MTVAGINPLQTTDGISNLGSRIADLGNMRISEEGVGDLWF
jgi:hypothetical protein